MRLIVIPISHYCERARWALDWAGVDYVEDRHLQIFHARAVKRAGGRKTVPVLVREASDNLYDSADIVAFASSHAATPLYPSNADARSEIEAFEAEVAGDFGVETRRYAYFELLTRRDLLMRYNNQGAPRVQVWALRLGYPLVVRRARSYLEVTEENVEKGRAIIDDTFDRVAERLADGRPFLFGDAFTAADLTFASMAVPMVLPDEYGVALPRLNELTPSMKRTIDRYRSHPAGAFALRLYREQRRA